MLTKVPSLPLPLHDDRTSVTCYEGPYSNDFAFLHLVAGADPTVACHSFKVPGICPKLQSVSGFKKKHPLQQSRFFCSSFI